VHNDGRQGQKWRQLEHALVWAPPHARWWTGDAWDLSAKNRYQQYICRTPGCRTPGWRTQVRTYCKCSTAMWICTECMLDHIVDGVASVASEHWVQFSIFRFFWWLEFASQVDNLVIKYINDRSQTRSWQCVDVFWYVQFHQRITCDFVTIVSKYIEFNVLGAYSSEYETTVCMFFLPVDTLLTFDNGTKYVPGKLSSTVYSGWGRHCWKWEGKSEWPNKDQAVWFVTCVLVAVIWITSCINDMHVPYHTHQM
jgi:predicted DCC family thiol-disulfide oxidoreductase YuxK